MPIVVNGYSLPTLDELEQLQVSGKLDLTESRTLTDEEREQMHADRKARAKKFDVGDESESRGRAWLMTYFKAEVQKNPLRLINTPAGQQFVSQDVDYTLLRPIGGLTKIIKVEVKGTITDSFPLSRISTRERGFLEKSLRFKYDTWILCLWWHKTDAGQDCELMHLVPWVEWKQIEADLQAKATGNFKGKSIRRKIDLAGWEKYTIHKVNGRWRLDESHWLRTAMPDKLL